MPDLAADLDAERQRRDDALVAAWYAEETERAEPESAAARRGVVKAEPDKPEQDLGRVTDER